MRISDWSSDVCSSDLGESTLRPSGRRTALLAEQVFAFPETDRRILEGAVVVEIECRRCQIVLRNHLRRPGLALRRPPGRASDDSEAAGGLSLFGFAAMISAWRRVGKGGVSPGRSRLSPYHKKKKKKK